MGIFGGHTVDSFRTLVNSPLEVGVRNHKSQKRTGCFGDIYIGDYTTELYGDYKKPL